MSHDTKTNKECKEYNSLKYKTMIMTGRDLEQEIYNESSEKQLADFLHNEQNANSKQIWSKLSKTEKLKKIKMFLASNVISNHALTDSEIEQLNNFVNTALERKRLLKAIEVKYNEETGKIEEMPALIFNSKTRRFTLNRNLPTKNKSAKRKTKKQTTPVDE